jgi:hypothetical protein
MAKKASKTKQKAAAKKAKTLRKGDKVSWQTSQGRTTGRVVKKQTRATKIKTHKVAASRSNPEYIVETDKSHKRAAHNAGALKRR